MRNTARDTVFTAKLQTVAYQQVEIDNLARRYMGLLELSDTGEWFVKDSETGRVIKFCAADVETVLTGTVPVVTLRYYWR